MISPALKLLELIMVGGETGEKLYVLVPLEKANINIKQHSVCQEISRKQQEKYMPHGLGNSTAVLVRIYD